MTDPRDRLRARALELIGDLTDGGRDDTRRDALLCDLMAWQGGAVEPVRRLLAARGVGGRPDTPDAWPALPTDVFRFARVAAHAADLDVRVFRTSGTAGGARGVHALRDLALYDAAARAAARRLLFADLHRPRLVLLAPSEAEAPGSSLAYMLARFTAWFGDGGHAVAWRRGALELDVLRAALARAVDDRTPVALLGTSFAFVHAEDRLAERFRLPERSLVMQTGGYKGRSREVDPAALRTALASRYGVPEHRVVAEYGMTELSSQMYESSLIAPEAPRRLEVPGWMRAVPVDPESLAPVAGGEVGILRIDDVANLDGACAIQTSDLARRAHGGIELLGRAPGSTPRGCSLAVEEALGR